MRQARLHLFPLILLLNVLLHKLHAVLEGCGVILTSLCCFVEGHIISLKLLEEQNEAEEKPIIQAAKMQVHPPTVTSADSYLATGHNGLLSACI